MPDGLSMVAEEVDPGGIGSQFDFHCPGVLRGVEFHVLPLVIGEGVGDVGSAAIRAAVVHPPDATALGAGARLEGHRDREALSLDAGTDSGRFQEGILTAEKVVQEEGRLVSLVFFPCRVFLLC